MYIPPLLPVERVALNGTISEKFVTLPVSIFCPLIIKRRVIITEKVKLLLTLYRPLPPPFLLSKSEASCSFPPKSQQKLHWTAKTASLLRIHG